MKKESAGLLMYRKRASTLEVLLVHPGGPFWKNKDSGAWSIPKGEIQPGESALDTARREFEEELGFKASGPFFPLGSVNKNQERLFTRGPFAATAIHRVSEATSQKLSGRRSRAKKWKFLRSTGRNSFPFQMHGKKSIRSKRLFWRL